MDTDSSRSWTDFQDDRGQFSIDRGMAVTMPCRHREHDCDDEESPAANRVTGAPWRSRASCGPSGSHAPRKRTDDVDAQAASWPPLSTLSYQTMLVASKYRTASEPTSLSARRWKRKVMSFCRSRGRPRLGGPGNRDLEDRKSVKPSTHRGQTRRIGGDHHRLPRHCPRWPGIAGFLERNTQTDTEDVRIRHLGCSLAPLFTAFAAGAIIR